MNFDHKVYEVVMQIPKGYVMSYGQIGKKLNTKAYRAIGQALRRNPYAPEVPCHRVVRSDLTLGGFRGKTKGSEIIAKRKMLEAEGVVFNKNKVSSKCLVS